MREKVFWNFSSHLDSLTQPEGPHCISCIYQLVEQLVPGILVLLKMAVRQGRIMIPLPRYKSTHTHSKKLEPTAHTSIPVPDIPTQLGIFLKVWLKIGL